MVQQAVAQLNVRQPVPYTSINIQQVAALVTSPTTDLQKDILLRRKELFIGGDGVSFCHKKSDFREYYYLVIYYMFFYF